MRDSLKYALEREIACYAHPRYYKLFIASCFSIGEGKSEHARKIIKYYFDKMTPEQIKRLEKIYDEMTPEQRKKPKINE